MLTHRVNGHEYITWLLQFKTCRSPKVYYYTLTACTKHSSETGGSVQTVRRRDHNSNVLCDPHWLSVQYRITYKLSLLLHLIHNNQAPSYLAESITATTKLYRRRRLRSATGPWSASSFRCEQHRTRLKPGERCYVFAGPAAWNGLPPYVQELSNTECFKCHLKTFFQTMFWL